MLNVFHNIGKQNQVSRDFALLKRFHVYVNHCGTHITQDRYGWVNG